MAPSTQIKRDALLMAPGHHVAAWRHPDATEYEGCTLRENLGLRLPAPRRALSAEAAE